jgi:hypothetical protein
LRTIRSIAAVILFENDRRAAQSSDTPDAQPVVQRVANKFVPRPQENACLNQLFDA